jgi:hypothetical protein
VAPPALWIAVTNGYVRADQVIEVRHHKHSTAPPERRFQVRVLLPVTEGATGDEGFGPGERVFAQVAKLETATELAASLVRFLAAEQQVSGIVEYRDGRPALRE